MFLSLFFKVISNSVIFLLIPFFWGSAEFGDFILLFLVAGILTLFVDNGFSISLVKDLGRDLKNKNRIFSEALELKVCMTIFMLVVIVIVGLFKGFNLLLIILLFANIFYSFTLFFYLPMRVSGDFKEETKLTFISNIFLIFSIVVLLFLQANALLIAVSILIIRLMGCFSAIYSLKKYINITFSFKKMKIKEIFYAFKKNLPYAVHISVGTLFIQLDTIIVSLFLSIEDVGVYQLAIRIMLASLIFSDVLNGVFLPKMSKFSRESKELNELSIKMFKYGLTLGVIVVLILFVSIKTLVNLFYNEEYIEVINLMKILCVVILIKYINVTLGTLLTLDNKQTLRVLIVICSLLINIVANLVLIPLWGLYGAAISSILSNLFLLIVYLKLSWKENLKC